jgi:hypothetical protein
MYISRSKRKIGTEGQHNIAYKTNNTRQLTTVDMSWEKRFTMRPTGVASNQPVGAFITELIKRSCRCCAWESAWMKQGVLETIEIIGNSWRPKLRYT